MAKITLEEQPEFLVFPVDSILDLKIEECTVKTVQGNRGEWQKVEFKFKILGIQALGDGAPASTYDSMITQSIFGSVPFRLTDNPENKLRIWAEAILQTPLGLGFELDTDMFVGRQVRGLTSQYQGKNGARHQIETLLPKSGAAGATSAPTPQATQAAPAQDPWATPANTGAGSSDPWGEPPF